MSSCLSPTLPLPPPDPPSMISQDATTGAWEVSGNCLPGATVSVVNNATGLGMIFEDRRGLGVYAVELAGTLCDSASVSQTLYVDGAYETGGPTNFELAPRTDATPTDNPVCQ